MSLPVWLKEVPGGCELAVLVQPRASRTKVVGEHDGRITIYNPAIGGACTTIILPVD